MCGLGVLLLRVIVAAMPADTLPSEVSLHLNAPVLAVTLVATIFAGVLSGCAPAWYASRVDPAASLKEGGRAGAGKESSPLAPEFGDRRSRACLDAAFGRWPGAA